MHDMHGVNAHFACFQLLKKLLIAELPTAASLESKENFQITVAGRRILSIISQVHTQQSIFHMCDVWDMQARCLQWRVDRSAVASQCLKVMSKEDK